MVFWCVGDLSKLTNVSVQTLHHYDRIGLLKPSLRLSNGYRAYHEPDVVRLQQIVALKFFGFELAQIQKLLMPDVSIHEHFLVQEKILREKSDQYNRAASCLRAIIEKTPEKDVHHHDIIKLTEVFYMLEKDNNTWVGKILTPEELKDYVSFEKSLEGRIHEKESFTQKWQDLVNTIKKSYLTVDPASPKGIALGKSIMDLVDRLYGKEFAHLKCSIWEKGFKKGLVEGQENYMPPEIIDWMDKATTAYHKQRIHAVIDEIVQQKDDTEVLGHWNALMEEMFGSDQTRINGVVRAVLEQTKSDRVKQWFLKLETIDLH